LSGADDINRGKDASKARAAAIASTLGMAATGAKKSGFRPLCSLTFFMAWPFKKVIGINVTSYPCQTRPAKVGFSTLMPNYFPASSHVVISFTTKHDMGLI
jgi:hypothetical protein